MRKRLPLQATSFLTKCPDCWAVQSTVILSETKNISDVGRPPLRDTQTAPQKKRTAEAVLLNYRKVLTPSPNPQTPSAGASVKDAATCAAPSPRSDESVRGSPGSSVLLLQACAR